MLGGEVVEELAVPPSKDDSDDDAAAFWFKICTADPRVARVTCAVTNGGGGLCSWLGDVV